MDMQFRIPGVALLMLQVLFSGSLQAQEPEPAAAEAAAPLQPLDEESSKAFTDQLELIDANKSDIERLKRRIAVADGLLLKVLQQRQDVLAVDTLKQVVDFAGKVVSKKADGYEVAALEGTAKTLLENLPEAARLTLDRLAARIVLPDLEASAADQATKDRLFFDSIDEQRTIFRLLLDAIDVGKQFGIDVAETENDLKERLANYTENLSVFLELAIREAEGAKAATSVLQDDAELKAKEKIADRRVQSVAVSLERNLKLLSRFDFNTTRYRKQLLSVTGEVSTGLVDLEVVGAVLESWWTDFVTFVSDNASSFVLKAVVFFVTVYFFVALGRFLQRLIGRGLDAGQFDLSQLARNMILSITRNLVVMLGLLVALSQVGISLGPLLTGLGIAGFIVGFALQDSLSNFASGMLILLYRPFDVGDTIEAAGARGRVSHMSLVNTTIMTFDNQTLIVPNNKIWQDVIKNVTSQTERRIDMEFPVAYDEDIDRVEALLHDILKGDERVLAEPEPQIKVGSFGDSSVNIICRPWVNTENYWDVLFDLNKQVKQAFDREGIAIPFPQRDVHIYQEPVPAER